MDVSEKTGDPIPSRPEDFRLLAAAKALTEYRGEGNVPFDFAMLLMQLKEAVDAKEALPMVGATGEFPSGQAGPDDEGALQVAVGARRGFVRVEFGKPVAFLQMHAGEARTFAGVLTAQASLAEQDAVADDVAPPC